MNEQLNMSATATPTAQPPKVKRNPIWLSSTPFWWGKGHDRIRICYVSGIPNSYPEWGGPARIDVSIANLVKIMNEAGIETNYCCSNRRCDHTTLHGAEPWQNAYISFVNELPASFIAMLPDKVRVEPSNAGVRRIIRFKECTGRELAKQWKRLEYVTLRWWGIQEGH